MANWLTGWTKSSNDAGTTYIRNRGTLVIALVAILVASSGAHLTQASFWNGLACWGAVMAVYCGIGKYIEFHNSRHPETTSFAVRRTRL